MNAAWRIERAGTSRPISGECTTQPISLLRSIRTS
ncbi:uncharacterized protein METZ01_LOCUS90330 [marine metagenome]|uniref:Uncharacterized protein n=1 Tax=marine metagenome TaxID=408172 RepID=A0A381VAS4_9ZZZZ